MFASPIGDEAFKMPHAHGRLLLGANAQRLALRLLGTHPPRDARQNIVGQQNVRRAVEIVLGHRVHKSRDVHADRATLDAFGVLALQASLGFLARGWWSVALVDFPKVARPLERILLGHILTRNLHAFRWFHLTDP